MIKPLLRVIPELSGNVKISCDISNFRRDRNWDKTEVYATEVKYARLLPLSSSLYQKKIDIKLLSSSYEYDLKDFYRAYADDFFSSCFTFNKNAMMKLKKDEYQMLRATDFQFGAKRIEYLKEKSQFSFFAPFYADKLDDMPAYFLMNLRLNNGRYYIDKKIKVNIMSNSDSTSNYLCYYLKRYGEKLDSKVAFCSPEHRNVTYFGIDLKNGGFVKATDNVAVRMFDMHNTIHNFDAMATHGFKRNAVAMKQIIPLSFNFTISDILTPQEKYRYTFNDVEMSGEYYDINNNPCGHYDFDIDYDFFEQQVLRMSEKTGDMVYVSGNVKNIMDVPYPSLNDARFVDYRYANKVDTSFCRWKMLYSDDEHPYVMNMSWAFSKNQFSNFKYGEFPTSFAQIESLATYVKMGDHINYNLIFPLDKNREIYDKYNTRIHDEYANIMNQYSLNWFRVIPEYNESIYKNEKLWKDVDDGHVYYDGILYNLNNVYNLKQNPEKVDKFAMLLTPKAELLTTSYLNTLKFADWTLYLNKNDSVVETNCVANPNIIDMCFNDPTHNYIYENEHTPKRMVDTDEIRLNRIFSYAGKDGDYVDINDLGIDYYKLNRYYKQDYCVKTVSEALKESRRLIKIDKEVTLNGNKMIPAVPAKMYTSYYGNAINDSIVDDPIEGYLFIPMYRSGNITYSSYNTVTANPGIIDFRGCENEDYMNRLKDGLHVHSINEPYDRFSKSYTVSKFAGENDLITTYSYFTTHDVKLNDMTCGNTFYMKDKFVRGSLVDSILTERFNPSLLKSYITTKSKLSYKEHGMSYWNYDDISYAGNWKYNEGTSAYEVANPYAYSCYLYKACDDFMSYVNTIIAKNKDKLDYDKDGNKIEHPQYQVNPIKDNNGVVFVHNAFTRASYFTGHFYGDQIPEDKVTGDMDVLWADVYNLAKIFNNYYDGQVPFHLNSQNSRKFFCQFMDLDHVYYFYTELFLNEYHAFESNPRLLIMDKEKDPSETLIITNKTGEKEFLYNIEIEQKNFYKEWYDIRWKSTIFYREKKLIYDPKDEECQKHGPIVKYLYRPIVADKNLKKEPMFDGPDKGGVTFLEWYSTLRYDNEKHLFYYEIENPDTKELEKSDYFDLCFQKDMYRVSKYLWRITDIADTEENDIYKDIYFYRIEDPKEYDYKYYGSMKTIFANSVANLKDFKKFDQIVTGNINPLDEGEVQIEPIAEPEDKDFEHLKENIIEDIDGCLVPMFDSIFSQDEDDALIVAHYMLRNISEARIVDENGNADDTDGDTYNYRYNRNDKVMMLEFTDEDKKKYPDVVKTYKEYDTCKATFDSDDDLPDDLGYRAWHFNTKVVDGVKYGFYLINANINNTSNTFRTTGIVENDYITNIKYLYYINGVNILERPDYIAAIYKQLSPFIKMNPMSLLTNLNNVIIYPTAFTIPLIYMQSKISNDVEEMNITSLQTKKPKPMTLVRYMHAMTPLITPRVKIRNAYKLKLKDVDRTLIDTGKYISIGDSVLYKSDERTDEYFPTNVYTTSIDQKKVPHYRNIAYKYTPVEYSHYNCSKLFNLKEEFKIPVERKLKYYELRGMQTDSEVRNVFGRYISKIAGRQFEPHEVLFLLNKYIVQFDSVPVGVTTSGDEKLYSMTYVFTLK